MEREYLHTPLTKSVMAGLFAGLIATVISLVFNLTYRGITGFELSPFINVSTIIFVIPLLLLPAGFIYHLFSKYKLGQPYFLALLVLLIVLGVVFNLHFQRSTDPVITENFRRLLLGIILITGLTSFFIPYLASHETSII